MSIAKRIQESISFLNERDLEASLLPLSIAIDATAGKEFPEDKNRTRIRMEKWLRTKQGFITWYLLKGAEITGNITFPIGLSLETVIYKWIRCPLMHEAKLDPCILLTQNPVLGTKKGDLFFSQRHVEGLILAVICSSVNSTEQSSTKVKCTFFPGDVWINDLWGKEQFVRKRLDLINNRWL